MVTGDTRFHYNSLKVLYSTNCPSGYIPPVPLSAQMFVCGPNSESLEEGGQLVSLQTPKVYDLAGLVRGLPQSQQPDLVVVRTDAALDNLPVNLAAVACPKVLLFADTHHTRDPLRTALHYAASEPFDQIVLLYDHHHLHWFVEAGFDNVSFLPGLEVRDVPTAFVSDRTGQIAFVGQFGKLHSRREWLLGEMVRRGYDVNARLATREDSAALYAQSSVTFNCSLNGDLNLRVFEALAAGGLLLTDKLSPESGLDVLFAEDKHVVCYRSVGELFEKLDHFLHHPQEALTIARRGYERFHEFHRPETKMQALLSLIFDGQSLPDYDVAPDARAQRYWPTGRNHLQERLPAYEFLQELHRWHEIVNVLCCGAVDLCCDLVDLPRLNVMLLHDDTLRPQDQARIRAAGVADRVALIEPETAMRHEWHVVVIDKSRWHDVLELTKTYRGDRIVATGFDVADYPAVTAVLAGCNVGLEKIGGLAFRAWQRVTDDAGETAPFREPSSMTLFTRVSELVPVVQKVPGWLGSRAGETLYRLVRLHAPIPTVVELGAWKGRSSAWLASALRDRGEGRLYSVDTWRGTANEMYHQELLADYAPGQLFEEFWTNLSGLGLMDIVEPIRSDTIRAAQAWPVERKIGLLFIDADHEYEAVKRDFEAWSPYVVDGGFVVFDDVPSWPGPTRMVSELSLEYRFVHSGNNNWICQKLPSNAGSVS